MSSQGDDVIRWLESQFAKDRQKKPEITHVLVGGAHLLFDKPSSALREISTGKRPREAAVALFWYCYHFSDEPYFPDKYLVHPKEGLANRKEGLTPEVYKFALWATDVLRELIAFRDEFVWAPSKRRNKETVRYVRVMLAAARIIMLLRNSLDYTGRIEYSPTIRELIEHAYEIVSHGINEADITSYSRQEMTDKTRVYGEDIIGFSACVACTIINAAYAHMVNALYTAYETSFHAYVDAFRYIQKAALILNGDILSTLFFERSLYLSESLVMFDKVVKRPEGVQDWDVVKRDFIDFHEILVDADFEEEVMLNSGINEQAPPDWYYPTQMEVIEGLARQGKWKTTFNSQSGPFIKDKPFSNVIKLREILGRCTEYIWWADPHFRTRAFAEIVTTAKSSRIKEVKILSRSEMVDNTVKSEYRRFKREMKGKGITAEWRTAEKTPFHDRFIMGANVVYNVPPVGIIFFEGEYSEWNVSHTRPPFEEWWQLATPVQ
jgi:hypothetical protein